MCLFLGENIDKFREMSDTSASEEVEQLVVAVTRIYSINNVFSLRPRDTSGISKLSDKRMIGINDIQ